MTFEQPLKMAATEDTLALLKRKLDDTHPPEEVNAAESAYGAPVADIKWLASIWEGRAFLAHAQVRAERTPHVHTRTSRMPPSVPSCRLSTASSSLASTPLGHY